MSNSQDYIFFEKEIDQRMHSIIGPQPLQAYLVYESSKDKDICSAYDEQVQYFILEIEPDENYEYKQRITRSASQFLGKSVKYKEDKTISNHQLSSSCVFFQLAINQAQAIVQVHAFIVSLDIIVLERQWRQRLTTKERTLVQGLLREAALFQFTGLNIQLILVAKQELRIQIKANLLKLSIIIIQPIYKMEVQSLIATINQKILQNLQNTVMYREDHPLQVLKIDKLASWKDIEVVYLLLDWPKRVEIIYRTHVQCGLTFYKGRLAKSNNSSYLNSICSLVREIITTPTIQITPDLHTYISKIIEEDQKETIFRIFQQLYQRLVTKKTSDLKF